MVWYNGTYIFVVNIILQVDYVSKENVLGMTYILNALNTKLMNHCLHISQIHSNVSNLSATNTAIQPCEKMVKPFIWKSDQ